LGFWILVKIETLYVILFLLIEERENMVV